MNSKQKGNRGERELAKVLREYGFETRRSQQYAGGTQESADVVGLKYIHIECKRVERLNIDDAIQQAIEDCNFEHNLPSVFHRKNGKQWLVTMRLDDWMRIYQEYYSGKELEKRKMEGLK